jgi:hypothetical protein
MNLLTFFAITIFCLLNCFYKVQASTLELTLKQEKIAFMTPNIFNSKYFGVEFGFLISKQIKSLDYHYNAYVDAFIVEESYTTPEQLRSGALGFKGGVLLPTQPWIPLFFQAVIGYAKTAFHDDPWLGRREKSNDTGNMFLAEIGALYSLNGFLIRYAYQINTIDYFTRNSIFSLGVNF